MRPLYLLRYSLKRNDSGINVINGAIFWHRNIVKNTKVFAKKFIQSWTIFFSVSIHYRRVRFLVSTKSKFLQNGTSLARAVERGIGKIRRAKLYLFSMDARESFHRNYGKTFFYPGGKSNMCVSGKNRFRVRFSGLQASNSHHTCAQNPHWLFTPRKSGLLRTYNPRQLDTKKKYPRRVFNMALFCWLWSGESGALQQATAPFWR